MAGVLQGQDDWLFLTNDTNKVIEQITGTFQPHPTFSLTWRKLFDYRAQKAAELNFKYVLLIAPNKECVYSDKLPDNIILSDARLVFKVMAESWQTKIDALYPIGDLVSARSVAETYSKGDTHWNGWGALVAFNLLAEKAGIRQIAFSDVIMENRTISGDLSSKIGGTTQDSFIGTENSTYREVYNNNVQSTGSKIIYENTDKNLPTAVFFRDSFSEFFLPLIAMSFRRVVVVWQPNLDYGIIKSEMPDFVFSQQAERFLFRCPPDQSGRTNDEYVRLKLAASQNG